MLIKHPSLAANLNHKLHAIYVLLGQEHYLVNDAAFSIKKAWRQKGETDETTLHLNAASDWNMLLEEANSYSLFSELVMLDARCDKKSIDTAGKEILNTYLQQINPRCLIILRAPNITAKQLQWLTNNEHIVIVQVYALPPAALQNWIRGQLQASSINFQSEIPALIHQYTQGNMLACAQVIEKLKLISNADEALTPSDVLEQLIDQCDYQLYELADACLTANGKKAIHLLRRASLDHTEPTLILWLFSQEIRLLIQLSHLLKQAVAFTAACNQLKIWPQRANLYQTTLARISPDKLYQLLHFSAQVDEQIKSNRSERVWHAFEQMALTLCSK